jgi:protein-tyrosine phosphatase
MNRIRNLPLWFGNIGDGRDVRRLMDEGTLAVIELAAEEPPLALPRDLISCRLPLYDGSGNTPALLKLAVDLVSRFIEMRTPTLVCCSSGLSRAPAVTAAALAKCAYLDHDAEAWLAEIGREHRLDVTPALWGEIKSALETA